MPKINVSKDALEKVKSALNEYDSELSAITPQIHRNLQGINEECNYEMRKIDAEIERVEHEIDILIKAEEVPQEEIKRLRNYLAKLRAKREKMVQALGKLHMDMDYLETASRKFESKAGATTVRTVGNIEKCIIAIDEYLAV